MIFGGSSSSSSAGYDISASLASSKHDPWRVVLPPARDDEKWIADYARRLREEKERDPKTLIGWALKFFF